jgi:hypothetical protein
VIRIKLLALHVALSGSSFRSLKHVYGLFLSIFRLAELVPNPGVPNFFTPLPFGLGGLQMCPYPKGEDFVKATYDIDFADSAWAQLGYASIFMGAFLFFAIRALANIDHSSLAAIQVRHC